MSSVAIVVFGVWILETVVAILVPTELKKTLSSPNQSTITIVVSAYLPNEKDIILETISHALYYISELPGQNYVILTYRNPIELEVEKHLCEIADREPQFRLLKINDGIGKPHQMNEAVKVSETDFVCFIDADSRPVPVQKSRLEQFLENNDIVQGRNTIRNTEHILGKVVAIELSTEYLISYLARAHWTKVAYFCGSNCFWRREAASLVLFSSKTS